jgi:asparagine synthase (glutamine-hydrolysing)
MCGIVGIVAQRNTIEPGLLSRATDALAHRGPDDSGQVILQPAACPEIEIGLGHRRLSILDLSGLGHQPMNDPDTGNWIVFNGEIYNFRELRRELQQCGCSFRSHSDTEVLLKAYAAWGEACLKRLRGIFAFTLWDARRNVLFLARDPLGVKPLYYSQQGERFLFASEIRALLRTGLVPQKLDRNGLFTFLNFGSIYEPYTAVEGAKALPPGKCLIWERGRLLIESYWTLPATDSSNSRNSEERVAPLIVESICSQTVSDVPVGVFLSGGIDSSAITAVLSRSRPPATFSVVFRESEYNESAASRLIAQRFKTDHHEILCSAEEGIAASHDAVSSMDQPSIDGLNTFLICRKAKEAGIKVVLSGLGGDELFGGYRSFRSVPKMERFLSYWTRVPAARGFADFLLGKKHGSDSQRKLHALTSENGNLVHPYFLTRALFTPADTRRLLPIQQSAEPIACLRHMVAETMNMDAVNRVSYLESRCYMLNTLLRDSDVMSMAHGVELRVPLIDPRLAECMFSVPGRRKLDKRVPKPLLVNAVEPDLPPEIIHRRKQGFTFPFERWLRDQAGSEVERSIRRIANGPLSGAIDSSAASQVWLDFQRGLRSWSRPWALHVLQKWCEHNQVFAAT